VSSGGVDTAARRRSHCNSSRRDDECAQRSAVTTLMIFGVKNNAPRRRAKTPRQLVVILSYRSTNAHPACARKRTQVSVSMSFIGRLTV